MNRTIHLVRANSRWHGHAGHPADSDLLDIALKSSNPEKARQQNAPPGSSILQNIPIYESDTQKQIPRTIDIQKFYSLMIS